jgi:ADP-heptose:LPS heptosyltransferase
MIFDLSTSHMGDILMAMPALRSTDAVIAQERHRFAGAPFAWLDPGEAKANAYPAMRRGRHTTESWLESTGRGPVRHRLAPEIERTHTVIVPAVVAPAKQWHLWQELIDSLPDALVVEGDASREAWLWALGSATTVICPDTGTAHMADALGCPQTIVLHGVPRNWPHCAPYWDRRYCIARESMAAITVEDVLEVVRG